MDPCAAAGVASPGRVHAAVAAGGQAPREEGGVNTIHYAISSEGRGVVLTACRLYTSSSPDYSTRHKRAVTCDICRSRLGLE